MGEKRKPNKKTSKKKNSSLMLLWLILLIVIIIIAVVALLNRNTSNNDEEIEEVSAEVEEPYVTVLENGSKLNTSEEVAKTRELDGLTITNTQIIESNGMTTLLADVTNNTNSTIAAKDVKIDILDDTNKLITTIRGMINETTAGETIRMEITVSADIANAYDFTIYE